LCKYTFVQRRNRLTTHFSERIPVVKRRVSVFVLTSSVATAHLKIHSAKPSR